MSAVGIGVFALLPFMAVSPITPWTDNREAAQPIQALGATYTPEDTSLRSLDIPVRIDSVGPRDRMMLKHANITLDGEEITDKDTPYYWITYPELPLPEGVAWAEGHLSGRSVPDSRIGTQLHRSVKRATSLGVEGVVVTERARIVGVMPFKVGARIESEGAAFRIDSAGGTTTEPDRIVVMNFTTVEQVPMKSPFVDHETIDFLLITRSNKAVPLRLLSGYGQAYPFPAGGVTGRHTFRSLQMDSMRLEKSAINLAHVEGLDGARIAVIRWEQVSARPVRTHTTNLVVRKR